MMPLAQNEGENRTQSVLCLFLYLLIRCCIEMTRRRSNKSTFSRGAGTLKYLLQRKFQMKRRTVLQSLSLAAGFGFPPLTTALPLRRTSGQPAFPLRSTDTLLTQSGVYGQEVFVVGVLRCSHSVATQKRISEIRKLTRFRLTLSHHSRTKFKTQYFSSLVDDWLAHDQVVMCFRVIRPSAKLSTLSPSQRMSDYIGDLTSTIARGSGIAVAGSRIVTLPRFRSQQQVISDEMLLTRNKRIASIENIKKYQCDLLQLLSTVTGVIRASEHPLERAELRNSSKSLGIAKLRTSLDLKDFGHLVTTQRLQLVIV